MILLLKGLDIGHVYIRVNPCFLRDFYNTRPSAGYPSDFGNGPGIPSMTIDFGFWVLP